MVGKIEVDGVEQRHIEIEIAAAEKTRVTYIPHSWAGAGGIGIQIRNGNGHLNQGPEIRVETVGSVVAAVVDILRTK